MDVKAAILEIQRASFSLECLCELPGYNGSILTISDDRAAELSKILDEVAKVIESYVEGSR